MKKSFLGKISCLSVGFAIIMSLTVNAAVIGTSRATLSNTQTESTGDLVALWGTSGTGRLRVKSTNNSQIKAEAMRVEVNWFDTSLASMTTSSNNWSSWSAPFNLSKVNVGYYVKVSGSKAATGQGEFEVSQ